MAIRIVIDTNIYISAIFWNGKPRELIDLGRDGKVLIFTSVDIESEIADKLRTKFKLKKDDVNRILLDFSAVTLPLRPNRKVSAVQDDPDDNKFIECAIEGRADYIVSGDAHLLNLKEFEGIKILRASEFLEIYNQ